MSLSGWFLASHVCFFGCGNRSARVRPSDFSGGPTPSVVVSHVSTSGVRGCIPVVCTGSYCGVSFALVGCLVGLVSMYVYEKDVNRHAQQVKARIAWQVGRFRRSLCLGFILLFVA